MSKLDPSARRRQSREQTERLLGRSAGTVADVKQISERAGRAG
jgi:hypothetical protein